jgi:hypothetical protein
VTWTDLTVEVSLHPAAGWFLLALLLVDAVAGTFAVVDVWASYKVAAVGPGGRDLWAQLGLRTAMASAAAAAGWAPACARQCACRQGGVAGRRARLEEPGEGADNSAAAADSSTGE